VYLLLDANVTAGYYLPRSLGSKRARERIAAIFDSVRSGASDHFLYIPNFCIAEVFSVFAKHSFGRWNPHVKNKGTIDTRVYNSLVSQFSEDIHNGRFLYQLELSRYHILGIDLVAPIDHYFQISRGKNRRHMPAATFDHLIIAMGIQLAHVHGTDGVAVVTADTRLVRILEKCRQGIPAKTVRKLKLDRAAEVTGKQYSPDIFPRYADLVHGTKSDLASLFGSWPPPVGTLPKTYRWSRIP
jgi:hypothetical protein